MKKPISGYLAILFKLLVMIILLGGDYSSSRSAAIMHSSEGIHWRDGARVIEEMAAPLARLSVHTATCGDFYSNVDLLLENLSTKQIKGYEVSQTKVYENVKGSKSSRIQSGFEIKPGESLKVNFNGGFTEGVS